MYSHTIIKSNASALMWCDHPC